MPNILSVMTNNKNSERLELDILGMECINCAQSIDTYISKLDGIHKIDLNFSSETAIIDYNPDVISKDTIKNTIKKLGYEGIEDDEEEKTELAKKKSLLIHRNKIFLSVILTLIIMALSMKSHYDFLSFLNVIPDNLNYVILLVLTAVVIFYCGDRFLKGALTALKNKTSDMNSLISLGTLSSFIYSTVIVFNHIFGLNIKVFEHTHEVYFETAAMIISFILIGHYLEAVLKSKTSTSIKKLKELQSKFVTVIRNSEEITIPFRKVKKDDLVIIKSGDKVPVDGSISDGNCIVDESPMTGESKPVEKSPGDNLISGTILLNGAVKLKAEKVGKDTTLSKIINLVKEASNSKPKIQRLADKVSAVFVPAVIIIAVLTFIIWYLIIGSPFDKSLLYAVSVLIIACPCALGLAAPMAIVIGVGRAAENGILFNDVEAIEKMNKIDTVCFDKTGTLTKGEMTVSSVLPVNGFEQNELLKYVNSLEKFSNHPIAKSINKFCTDNNIDAFENVSEINNEHGLGITGQVNNKTVAIGSKRFIEQLGIQLDGTSVNNGLLVSIDNNLGGIIELADELKDDVKSAISKLDEMKINLYMISGDDEEPARKIADEVGIKNYSFKTFPEDKEKIVAKLQSEGKNVAMVGDGINDAPSLARANIGIAVGTGQDIAIDTADVVLAKGDLKNIRKAINISHHTVRIIKQNFFWAFFYNIIAIPLAAGVLSPYGIFITPVMASMFMAFSDVVTVMGNSLRLKKVNIN